MDEARAWKRTDVEPCGAVASCHVDQKKRTAFVSDGGGDVRSVTDIFVCTLFI